MRGSTGQQASTLRADVSPAVIETYVVDSLAAVPGVRRVGGRPTRESGVEVAISPEGEVEIVVRLLLTADADGPAVGGEVRTAALAYLEAMLGLRVSLLTVVVDGAEEA
jgi:uncharacterized alkaline shock family protein YloU